MVSHSAARTLGSIFVVEVRDQRSSASTPMSGAPNGRVADPFQPCAAWPIAFAASVRTSGQREVERRDEVGDERRPLETADRADRENRRQRIAAADPGAQRQQIGGVGRAPFLGLENREPRRRHDRAWLRARAAAGTASADRGYARTARHDVLRGFVPPCWSVASAALRALSAKVPRGRRVLEHLLRQVHRIRDRDVRDLARGVSSRPRASA